MLDFVIDQLLQIKEALEEGQNTQADHLVLKTVEIEQKQSLKIVNSAYFQKSNCVWVA